MAPPVPGVQLVSQVASATGFRAIPIRTFRLTFTNSSVVTNSSLANAIERPEPPDCEYYSYAIHITSSRMELICGDSPRIQHIGTGHSAGTWTINNGEGCGDDRDIIIAEYKKKYIDKIVGGKPTKVGPSYIAKCSDFVKMNDAALINEYWNFGEFRKGDGGCPKYTYDWVIMSPAMRNSVENYGLSKLTYNILLSDPWVGANLKINSGYRSPMRNFSNTPCGGSTAVDSPHMYGSAVDFDIPTVPKKIGTRKSVAKRWNDIAINIAKAVFIEDKPSAGFCGTKTWPCVHADWACTKYGAVGLNRAKCTAATTKLMTTLVAATLVNGSDAVAGNPAQAGSLHWEQREQVFDSLEINLDDTKADLAKSIGTDEKARITLNALLKKEIAFASDPSPSEEGGEGWAEYYLSLIYANALYGGDAAIPLVLDEQAVGTGNAATDSAAMLGDRGVPLLVSKIKANRAKGDEASHYADYVRVACSMLEQDTVKIKTNKTAVRRIITDAVKSNYFVVRQMIVHCLDALPKNEATGYLNILKKDKVFSVKEEAERGLSQ